jgi:hypothetical protein
MLWERAGRSSLLWPKGLVKSRKVSLSILLLIGGWLVALVFCDFSL